MSTTFRFQPGMTVATPGAIEAMNEAQASLLDYVLRHLAGDWGEEIDEEDGDRNEEACRTGARIFSAYRLSTGVKIWIITDGDDEEGVRHATTVLLPSEY